MDRLGHPPCSLLPESSWDVSMKHLSDCIRAFIKYFNKTMAKPFK